MFSMQTPIYKLDIPVSPEVKQKARHRPRDNGLRTLNNIKHEEKDGWMCLGTVQTPLIHKMFDDLVNSIIL